MTEPVRHVLEAAARGRFPAPNGHVAVLPAPSGPSDAVIGFTAHHVIATALDPDAVHRNLPAGDFGAPMSARFLAWIGDGLGVEPGNLDVVLAAAGQATGRPVWLREVSGFEHERVARADRYRDEIRTFVTPAEDGVLVIGRGLAGRLEVSLEIDPAARGRGLGRRMIEAARSLVAAEEVVFAQVAPGNAASLRAFLAAGFTPIGSEVLFLTRPS